ncbi:MAG: hypothetical protein AAGD01_16715 [Acidobacteriota bacterium]
MARLRISSPSPNKPSVTSGSGWSLRSSPSSSLGPSLRQGLKAPQPRGAKMRSLLIALAMLGLGWVLLGSLSAHGGGAGDVAESASPPQRLAFFDVIVRATPQSPAAAGKVVIVEGHRIVSVLDAARVRLPSTVKLIQGDPGRTLVGTFDPESFSVHRQDGADAATALAAAQRARAQSLGVTVPREVRIAADEAAELTLLECDPLAADAAEDCWQRVVGEYREGAWDVSAGIESD